jgi:hypothetical protein
VVAVTVVVAVMLVPDVIVVPLVMLVPLVTVVPAVMEPLSAVILPVLTSKLPDLIVKPLNV